MTTLVTKELLNVGSGANQIVALDSSGNLTPPATPALTGVGGLTNSNTWSAAQISNIVTVAYDSGASTFTPNFGLSNDFSITLTKSSTLNNPTNLLPGQSGHIGVTTSGNFTLSYGSYWKFGTAGAPTATTNGKDVLVYWVMDSTHIIAAMINGVQ